MDPFYKTISIIADLMTILGLSGLLTYSAIFKNKNLIGRKLFNLSGISFKISLITIIGILLFRFSEGPYLFILLIIKGNVQPQTFYWEPGKEVFHILAYILTIALVGPLYIFLSLTISTFSLYYPKLLFSRISFGRYSFDRTSFPQFTKLEIVEAKYGAQTSFYDVTDVVSSMISNGRLKVQSGNGLKGDPIFGVKKVLNVKYRLEGKESTISVNEDDYLELPK